MIPGPFTGRTGPLRLVIVLAAALSAASCGLIPGNSPGDAADAFYDSQKIGADPLAATAFTDEDLESRVKEQLESRAETFGAYRSHRKIGSNRSISIEADGRRESVTYIFEVTCENGRTRENLTIRRNRATEPYRISAYEIEEVPRMKDPAPMGTSST